MRRYRKASNPVGPLVGLLMLASFSPTLRNHMRTATEFILVMVVLIFVGAALASVWRLYSKLNLERSSLPVHQNLKKPQPSSLSMPPPPSLHSSIHTSGSGTLDDTAAAYDPACLSPQAFTTTYNLPLTWNLSILQAIEWKRFELLCKEYFRINGCDARETNVGADGGVDIRLYSPYTKLEGPVAIVQCKAWKTYSVGVKVVRELFGIMADEKIPRGFVMTSGTFTDEAERWAKTNGKELNLISGHDFIEKIRELPSEEQQHLLAVALEGDYSTPTCPHCDIKMVLRETKNKSTSFWGCPRFPRCRQTFRV